MPSTEQFAEQRMTILKHLQKELFSLLDTKNLGSEEIQTIHDEMRELSQAVLIALGLEITGEDEDGVIQAKIHLDELSKE